MKTISTNFKKALKNPKSIFIPVHFASLTNFYINPAIKF